MKSKLGGNELKSNFSKHLEGIIQEKFTTFKRASEEKHRNFVVSKRKFFPPLVPLFPFQYRFYLNRFQFSIKRGMDRFILTDSFTNNRVIRNIITNST